MASAASRSTSIPTNSSAASCWPTPARRGARARTTGTSRSGTSTAIAISSTASSASATRRSRCGKRSRESDWDEVGRQIAKEWDNRKRLAPGVTTPTIDDVINRAMGAGATAAKVCGAGGGGCLFCYGPPQARPAIAAALASGGARVLDYRIEMEGLRVG